jgi:uncharacterized protein
MSTTVIPAELQPIRPAPVDPRADAQMVRMRDGVRLATDVYLPEPAGRRFPAILIRLPYDKSGRETFMPAIARYLNASCLAAVIQDVRGKFRSEGVTEPFVSEAADGYDTLDWVVAQSWCNGVVGMCGDSYYGFTQWAAASTCHRALRAIVPRVGGSHFFLGLEPGRVPRIPFLEWMLQTFSFKESFDSTVLSGQPVGALPALPDALALPRERLLRLVEDAHSGRLAAAAFRDGAPAGQLQIPALHAGGWFDNLQRWQLDDWRTSSTKSPAAADQYLRMTVTDHHDFLLAEDGGLPPDHEHDDDALLEYLPRLLDEPVSFFHHYLKGREGSWRAPRVRYRVAYGDWEICDRWPRDAVEEVTLTCSRPEAALATADGGELVRTECAPSTDAERHAQAVEWTHDPSDPVPYLAESEWTMLMLGLPDESTLHVRADVPTFTSEPVEEPLDLLGPASADLTVDADGDSTHVIGRMLDVDSRGSARYVLEGSAIIDCSAGPTRIQICMADTAYRLRAGHRLRVAVSTSLFPLYLVHPGTEESPFSAVEHRSRTQRLIFGGGAGASLSLSVRRPSAQ